MRSSTSQACQVQRRQWVANLLGGRDEDDPVALEQSRAASLYVLASSAPQYRSAFLKVLRNPQHGFLSWTAQERDAYARTEAVRTAMSLSNANGGYLVPFTLDPAIVLTNTGALNPWRELATVKTTATNTWNGVTSAGVNAAWLSEGTEAADSSPTVGNISIATQKAAAWVYGSYEVLADSDFATQLPALLDDARTALKKPPLQLVAARVNPRGSSLRPLRRPRPSTRRLWAPSLPEMFTSLSMRCQTATTPTRLWCATSPSA